eukprot:345681_1
MGEFSDYFIFRWIIQVLVGIDDTETNMHPLRYLVANHRHILANTTTTIRIHSININIKTKLPTLINIRDSLTLKLSVLKCNVFKWKFIEIIDHLIIILYYISNSTVNQ